MQRQGKPVPVFFCSITGEIMRDPVATADGQPYERAAVESWLERNDTSPANGAKLHSKTLVPNVALRQAVEEWEHAYALHVRRADIELRGLALAAGSFKTVYRGTLRLSKGKIWGGERRVGLWRTRLGTVDAGLNTLCQNHRRSGGG
jgi:hypothetical protein